jgi:CDP-glycerol glycerophosphotransferase (TagB/SpsB family)
MPSNDGSNRKADVAICVHNLVLFETLEPVLPVFQELGLDFIFLVPSPTSDTQWGQMFQDTYARIAAAGYPIQAGSDHQERRYEIALLPYYPYFFEVPSRFRVKYPYGMSKPQFTFKLDNLEFDLILCYGAYDESLYRTLAETFVVGPTKFARSSLPPATTTHQQPTLLYLPTYGAESSLDAFIQQAEQSGFRWPGQSLVKFHHGTTYLEPQRVERVATYFDECFDHTTPLADLLARADVVLSDCSGAIFDAIAYGKPTLIFQPQPLPLFGTTLPLETEIVQQAWLKQIDTIGQLEETARDLLAEDIEKINPLKNFLFTALGDDIRLRFKAAIATLLAPSSELTSLRMHAPAFRRMLLSQVNMNAVLEYAQYRNINNASMQLLEQLGVSLDSALRMISNVTAVPDRLFGYANTLQQSTQVTALHKNEDLLRSIANHIQELISRHPENETLLSEVKSNFETSFSQLKIAGTKPPSRLYGFKRNSL